MVLVISHGLKGRIDLPVVAEELESNSMELESVSKMASAAKWAANRASAMASNAEEAASRAESVADKAYHCARDAEQCAQYTEESQGEIKTFGLFTWGAPALAWCEVWYFLITYIFVSQNVRANVDHAPAVVGRNPHTLQGVEM